MRARPMYRSMDYRIPHTQPMPTLNAPLSLSLLSYMLVRCTLFSVLYRAGIGTGSERAHDVFPCVV